MERRSWWKSTERAALLEAFLPSSAIGQSMNMSLCDWYADREVLLTGATSELGRTLLEKILRSFPRVKVHVVIRSLNGLSKDDRLKKIISSPRCDRLRQEDPLAISRVSVLEGNLLYEELGLSSRDRASLSKVSVAFHAAGPHDTVLEFCRELPRLEVVACVSSIFRHRGQIAECLLQNENVPDVPLALLRLPFVGPSYREPMPGFAEVMRGPLALMVGAGHAFGTQEYEAPMIPVDLAVNSLIAAAWERANAKNTEGPVVYNSATLECTWKDVIKKGRRANRNFPYPSFGVRGMTSVVTLHWILVLLFEWLPAVCCDTILSLLGAKQRFVREYERIRSALRSLESVSLRTWPAERSRVYQLQKRLSPDDQDAFSVTADIDIESYVLCAAATTRKYCIDQAYMRTFTIFRRVFLSVLLAAFLYVTYRVLRGLDTTQGNLELVSS